MIYKTPLWLFLQESTDDHPHLNILISAMGHIHDNGSAWGSVTVIGDPILLSPMYCSLQGEAYKPFCFSPPSGSSAEIRDFKLSDIIPPAKDLHSYYRYVGSMTTPGCEQAVAWTVFHKTLPVSSKQVSQPLVSSAPPWVVLGWVQSPTETPAASQRRD